MLGTYTGFLANTATMATATFGLSSIVQAQPTANINPPTLLFIDEKATALTESNTGNSVLSDWMNWLLGQEAKIEPEEKPYLTTRKHRTMLKRYWKELLDDLSKGEAEGTRYQALYFSSLHDYLYHTRVLLERDPSMASELYGNLKWLTVVASMHSEESVARLEFFTAELAEKYPDVVGQTTSEVDKVDIVYAQSELITDVASSRDKETQSSQGAGTTVQKCPDNIYLSRLGLIDGYDGVRLGGQLGDFAGGSVSGAGDVNNDGFDDVIVGANKANFSSGQSYVVFGTSADFSKTYLSLSSLNGSNGFDIDGTGTKGSVGHFVSGAGDVNNDGYDDLIVGGNGRSYVVFGKKSPFQTIELSALDGSNGFYINPIQEGDSLSSGSNAGDVNRDGYDDIIIGAPHTSPFGRTAAGETYVIFGSSQFDETFELSSLDGRNGFLISGIAGGDESGYAVSGAGDVNRDGYDDIIIGAPYALSSGQIYIIFGSSQFDKIFDLSNLDDTNGFLIMGADYRSVGDSVDSAGDINNDGYDDVVIGTTGEAYVVFGKSSQFDTVWLNNLTGTNGITLSGITNSVYKVSGAGDVNNDGFSDVIIGMPNVESSTGQSCVVFGCSNFSSAVVDLSELRGNVSGFTIFGNNRGEEGYSVSSAGDMNNDGYGDLIIGAPEISTSYIIPGCASSSSISSSLSESQQQRTSAAMLSTGGLFGSQTSSSRRQRNDDMPDDEINLSAQQQPDQIQETRYVK